MPYLFTCPQCQTKTQVEDRYSGQAGQCVTCGGAIQLPDFAADSWKSSAAAKTHVKTVRWVVATIVSLILLGCLLWAMIRIGGQTMTRLSSNRERNAAMANLQRIADALNAYSADHGSYPPSATRDESNKKLHSWRVLILPYLNEEDLYNEFDLNQPWNDPRNMRAAQEIPAVYQHPGSSWRANYLESSYYLITGKGTLIPNPGPLGPEQVTDDPAQTILVIQGTPIVPSGLWTEPIDLDFAKIRGNLGTNPGFEPGGVLEDGVAFATVDGRGHFVPDSIEPTIFRSLVTPRGGERLRDDTLD